MPSPPRILVVSDLHLGLGRDALTGAFEHRENFVLDEPFANWLAHQGHDPAGTVVILNGDTFDFLRIDETPSTAAEFEAWSARLRGLGSERSAEQLVASVSGRERRFGLRTDDYKSVWKLDRIGAGHPAVFAALAAHVLAGGQVLLTVGNHDVELHWPLVRRALQRLVAENGCPEALAAQRVGFVDEAVRFDNLWVEHGHRWEPMTAVDGGPLAVHDPTQLNLPLGSFVNRYFINRVEALDPFIDNVKPVERSVVRLARQRPLRILTTYGGGWRFIAQIAIRRSPLGPAAALLALLFVPPALAALIVSLVWNEISVLPDFVPAIPGAVLVALALAVMVVGTVQRARRLRETPPDIVGARRIVASADAGGGANDGVRYVCMGHTHVPGVYRLDEDGHGLYVNTGTWIALWPESRPDLRGRTVLSFARFDRDPDPARPGYRHQLLDWDDRAGRPRPTVVYLPAAQ